VSARVVSQAVLGVLALSVIGAGALGLLFGIPALLLGLAAGTLSLVIVLMWGSLQQMEESDEMEFEQALSYAAPSVEEEQKRALLRTLKDLEYELSVGKISRDDYDQIYAEVAEKAKRMIALTDEAMKARISAAEARVSARLDAPDLSKKENKKGRKQTRPAEEKEKGTHEDADEENHDDGSSGETQDQLKLDDEEQEKVDEEVRS
jgi:hypothetical protein